MPQATSPSIQASPQQMAVYQWIKNGRGNAIVIAVAGAGKTTTLVKGMEYTSGPTAFAAFNKKIADEIKSRTSHLPNVSAGTFHSFGNRAWRSVAPTAKLDDRKTYKLMDEHNTPKAMQSFVKKAISQGKQNGFGVDGCPAIDSDDDWYNTLTYFDTFDELPNYISEDQAITEVIKLFTISAKLSSGQKVIDFDDMIWLPLLHNAKIPQYSWVLVDEAQDSNIMRRIFAERMMLPDARFIAVGDPHQAIYGFSGAMNDSLQRFKADLGCIELPLTVSFRCPTAVVEVAQQWVHHIEAAANAPIGLYLDYSAPVTTADGQTTSRSMDWMVENDRDLLAPYTAILCRNTAPLIGMAYKLISEMIPCHVEGRDIGQGLTKLIKKFTVHEQSSDMLAALNEYAQRMYHDYAELKQDYKAAQLEDKVDTIQLIVENPAVGPLTSDVLRAIETLFADTDDGRERPDITLCTIHRSKGREWDRVIWLGREQLQPSKWAVKGAARSDDGESWQLDQETNLMYVAATRTKKELIEVDIIK